MNTVEMLKASWMEINAGSIMNCYQKSGIPLSPAKTSQGDARSTDSCLWTQAVAASLAEKGQIWDDFIDADEDVVVLERASDEAIVREVRPTIQDIVAPDDEGDDEHDCDDGVAPSPHGLQDDGFGAHSFAEAAGLCTGTEGCPY
ncbi:hypothetical protein IscW_ISCW021491 [Ixodes scapularis]|uniref:Tigger transposable element-derived protein 6-like n=1 Tax=Ixodes scapularis TaxID=6945 RepID=B7Q4D5_IXOSC|nr:hypothetical protein IscW_ISCW021491 [Ixodes scapularis]|eukprot:XP_002411520.1 hypothetical protein IscW_ISCW021491 [Ixodes scapularis]